MARHTSSVPTEDIPRIFERASTPVTLQGGSNTFKEATSISSPTEEGRNVFSPNGSVLTDITDDYGWDSPGEQQKIQMQTKSPSLSSPVSEDNPSDFTESGSLNDPPRGITREYDPDAAAPAAGMASRHSTTSTTSSERDSATDALENATDKTYESLELTKIWEQCSMTGREGFVDSNDYNQNKRTILSLGIDMNFSNRRQTAHANRPLHVQPEIQVTLPDCPADKPSYIRSTKTRSEQAMPSLSSILPISTRQFLAQNQEKCVAIKKNTNARCGSRRNLNIEVIYEKLDTLSISNITGINTVLQGLLTLMLCGKHQDGARKALASWFEDKQPVELEGHRPEIEEWIKALTRSPGLPQNTAASVPDRDIATGLVENPTLYAAPTPTGSNPLSLTKERISSPIQNFEPYKPKCHIGKNTSMMLREVLTAPLTKNEIEASGMIYIFWYQGNFGHLKIGHTRDLDKRLRTWEKDCGKSLDVHFPLDEDDKRPVQHVRRVEKLIHAELKDCRLKEACSNCNKTHIEWFHVSKDAAVSAARKWILWMRKQPYICETREDGKPQWRLDNEERIGSISDLCTLTPQPGISAATANKPHNSIYRPKRPTANYNKRKSERLQRRHDL
ncbi:meiotically up-regulated gene 113-domain-containing protein [Aspergillus heterothallicus]